MMKYKGISEVAHNKTQFRGSPKSNSKFNINVSMYFSNKTTFLSQTPKKGEALQGSLSIYILG